VNRNPYKSAAEHLQFDEAFDEQTISLINDAAQRKTTLRPIRIPEGIWGYIAAAAVIALLFIAVPLIRGPQKASETTVAAAMTAAGYETTGQSETTSVETTVISTHSTDIYKPGMVIKDGTMYVSNTTSRKTPYSINELTAVAENIFTGLCVSSGPVFQNDMLYTISEVQVTEVFKGVFQVGDIVFVLEMGGRTTIGELRKETSEEIKDFDHYDDRISADTKFVEGIDGYYPLKVDENVLLFADDTSGFLEDFTEPVYYPFGDYEGKMYLKKDNVYARNTPSNTDEIIFDEKSLSISVDELKLLI